MLSFLMILLTFPNSSNFPAYDKLLRQFFFMLACKRCDVLRILCEELHNWKPTKIIIVSITYKIEGKAEYAAQI